MVFVEKHVEGDCVCKWTFVKLAVKHRETLNSFHCLKDIDHVVPALFCHPGEGYYSLVVQHGHVFNVKGLQKLLLAPRYQCQGGLRVSAEVHTRQLANKDPFIMLSVLLEPLEMVEGGDVHVSQRGSES